MRPIKFRAWDGKTKTMLMPGDRLDETDGWLLYADGTFFHYDNDDYGKSGLWEHEVSGTHDRCELMQHTGLLDKDGKDIYEGDLLHNPHDENLCYEVIWDDSAAGFSLGVNGANMVPFQVHEFWKVIGNIYESPELIEQDGE